MVVYDPVNVCYRIKVAAEWSKLNQVEILPEMINCEDCRMDGVKTSFCDSLCQIRQCVMSQKVETCISCGQMKSCEKLKMISYNNDIFLFYCARDSRGASGVLKWRWLSP